MNQVDTRLRDAKQSIGQLVLHADRLRDDMQGADSDTKERAIANLTGWVEEVFNVLPPGFMELVMRLICGAPWESPPTYEALRRSVCSSDLGLCPPTARPENVEQ